jgi:hypothetical protein
MERFTERAAAAPASQSLAAVDAPRTAGSGHGHLWVLRDGTPAHAPPGRLTVGEDGRLACHLCGGWFTHLGAHLRRHGWTAAQYRDAAGLPLHVALCSADLSGQIAVRQKRAWDASPSVRARLEPGLVMARNGELSRLSAEAGRDRATSGQQSEASRTARAQQLAAGRAAQARQRQARLDGVVAAAGAADLHALLRDRYADGLSLDQLGRLTGLGSARLRAELRAADVEIRPTGVNQLASKQARADRNDALAAAQVGTADIRAWLLSRYEHGVTLRVLASQTGRSIPWVRSRLASTPRPQQASDGMETPALGQVSVAWGRSASYRRIPPDGSRLARATSRACPGNTAAAQWRKATGVVSWGVRR